MATPECIRLLEPQLLPCCNLDWLVYGQPVIALFSKSGNSAYTAFDREYLGQPSRHTRGQSLKLWIACACDDTNRLLVVLTQEIQVSSGKKPRIFYLCISVESLAVDTASSAYWTMSDGVVPLYATDQPDNAKPDQTSRLLRTSFSPAAKSWVVMPDFPHIGRVSDESMSLLRKLKALSQAPCFDLFTTHDSWTYRSLLRLKAILSNSTVTGFNINYNNFYPGGRRAIVDSWESQGWRPLEDRCEGGKDMGHPAYRKGSKRKHDAISNVVPSGDRSLPPPPYDLPEPDLSSVVASGAASEAAPGSVLGSFPGSAPDAASTASFDMAAVLANECAESGQGSVLSEVYPRGRSISLPLEITPKPLSPNFAFSPIASGVASAITPEPTTPVPVAAVFSSPFRSVALSLQIDYSSAAPNSAATPPPQAPPHYICKTPLSHIPETPPNYTLSACKEIALSTTNSWSILTNWLATLLKRYPYLHYICITELLALGSGIRKGDAEDTIRRLRARCLASFLDQVTDYDYLEVEHKFMNNGSSELEELVSWLLLLNPDGDLMFLEQLSEASKALKDVQKSEHIRGLAATPRSSDGALFDRPDHKDEYAAVNEFMICKASIILDACMAFGDSILGQSKHDIKDRMLKEMELLI